MKRLLYNILYIALAATASAQVKVTGRVIDLQNKPNYTFNSTCIKIVALWVIVCWGSNDNIVSILIGVFCI